MKETIKQQLQTIERDHHVKILYACESGSRAWGFPSKDSDYDVRFIYIHHPDWYLSIDEKREVIELPIDNMLDINGWDIRKALKLFRKSNPSLLEWISSQIIYEQKYSFVDTLKKRTSHIFSAKSCMHHYLSMAKGNARKHLQGSHVKIKKYFYVLRPVLACKWIESNRSVPPILFQQLVDELIVDPSLKDTTNHLLQRKMRGDECDLEPRIESIHEYVETQIAHLEKVVESIEHQKPMNVTESLDRLFRDTLKEVWGEILL